MPEDSLLFFSDQKPLPNGPFDYVTIFYRNNILDYVWVPHNKRGPNGERFLISHYNPDNDFNEIATTPTHIPETDWEWFATLEDAANELVTRKFLEKL